MAADVARFIRQHELKKATVIGHSMGAKTAMALALQSPELVHGIVAVDNAPVKAPLDSRFRSYIMGMRKIEDTGATRQKQAHEILKDYEQDETIRHFLLGNLHWQADKGPRKICLPLDILEKALDDIGDFPFHDPEGSRFEGPALFVRGTRSHYVPDEVIPIIRRFFPCFELVDVNAGHWLISENLEDFRKAVVRFLGPRDD